ncbi:hypothetical protein ScPMuIL_005722 [Solemya velum]
MIPPENTEPVEFRKIVQPRSHKANICVWSELTVDDVDRLSESLNADHIKQVLADIFHLDDHRENLKSGIVIDLYFYTLQFARDNNFNKEKTSTFFSIIKKIHEVCIETPFGNLDQTFQYFKDLLLCHAVNRPPHSIELFSPDEVRKITEYTVNTYFRHFKMYKYAFTPLVRLDLALNYVGVPVTPPPSEAEEVEMKDLPDEDQTEEKTEGEAIEDRPESKTLEPEESDARQELKKMIQSYLADEIKKMKLSVDEQLKLSEEAMAKKIEAAESNAGGKKSSRGSAKGKKK